MRHLPSYHHRDEHNHAGTGHRLERCDHLAAGDHHPASLYADEDQVDCYRHKNYGDDGEDVCGGTLPWAKLLCCMSLTFIRTAQAHRDQGNKAPGLVDGMSPRRWVTGLSRQMCWAPLQARVRRRR